MSPLLPSIPPAKRAKLSDFAGLALVTANLVPVYMVLKGRADLAALAYLYWAEYLVISCVMILRVQIAGKGEPDYKTVALIFFPVWFAGVALFLGRVMLGMLLNLPRDWGQLTREQRAHGDSAAAYYVHQVLGTIGSHIVESGMVLAVLVMAVSHGIGFVRNYIRNGQYREASVDEEIRHLMIRAGVTFGAMFVLVPLAGMRPPVYVLTVLVLCKAGAEMWRYAHEQRDDAPGVS